MDIIKIFAILMVVGGHIQGLFISDGEFVVARNFIEGVNMPLFFVINGYFLVKPIRDMDIVKIARTVVRYVYPVIVVSAIFATCRIAVASPSECIRYYFCVFKSYWFVWSLVMCILIAFAVSIVMQKISRAIGAICLSLIFFAVNMIPTASTILTRAVHLAPFFLVGCIWGRGGDLSYRQRFRKFGMFSALCYILIVIFAGDFRTNGLSFYANNFVQDKVTGIPDIVVYGIGRVFVGLLGIFGGVTISKTITERWPGVERISFLGTTTLGIYLLHWPLMPYLTQIVGCLNTSGTLLKLIYIVFFTGIVFTICHGITYYTMKYRMTRRFLWMVG